MNNLKEFFANTPEFKRLKELHCYFNNNANLKEKLDAFLAMQKKITRAKIDSNFQLLKELENEYKKMENSIIDIPFVEEYFELLELFRNTLNIVKDTIEKEIFNSFNI